MVDRCAGKTKEGKACSAKPRPGSQWCPWHDPALSVSRSQWSAKGGTNRSNRVRARKDLPADPMTMEQVGAYLGVVFLGVISRRIEPSIANAAANVAKTMSVIQTATEIEERLAAVELLIQHDNLQRGA